MEKTLVARYNFSEQAASAAVLLSASLSGTFTAEEDPVTGTFVVWRQEASQAEDTAAEPFTVSDFITALQEKSDAYYEKAYPSLPKPKFGYHSGSRYFKIWTDNGTQRFVHCFVEQGTHHVFKAAGWKAPAKGVRFTSLREAAEAFDGKGTGYLYAR